MFSLPLKCRVALALALVTALPANLSHAAIADAMPAAACNYLTGIGLPTTTYRQQADGSYRCTSPHIDIGTAPGKSGRMNNIAYAVAGGAQVIDSLQLIIDVANPDQAAAIHRRLKDVANTLARKLNIELSSKIEQAIAGGKNDKDTIGPRAISVIRTDRSAGAYEVRVLFE